MTFVVVAALILAVVAAAAERRAVVNAVDLAVSTVHAHLADIEDRLKEKL